MLARNEPQKQMRKVGMRKVGRWIDAGMCNATVNRFGLGLGSDRREWCCRCRREWFGAVANGSHRRDWVWVQIVTNGSELSQMVQTAVANGSDRRREWFEAVANGSDCRREWFRPLSRMVRSRREWFRPSSRMVQTVVANGSEPSRMVQTVANSYRRWFRSYRRRLRSYRRRWGSPATGFGSEATGFGSDGNWVWVSEALLGFGFRKITTKWVFVKFLIYILKLLVTKLFSSL